MKKATILILLVMVFISLLSACSVPVSVTTAPAATPSAEASVESSAAPSVEASTEASESPSAEASAEVSATPSAAQPGTDIAAQTKEFLMHGQEDQPEAGKLHWTQTFLDQVDIEAVYQQYLSGGGKAGDVTEFAEYLTENAPVPSNWKELFEADLLAQYGVKPSSYEDLGDNYYQVYIMNEGKEVPYVGLNARTGYFHG